MLNKNIFDEEVDSFKKMWQDKGLCFSNNKLGELSRACGYRFISIPLCFQSKDSFSLSYKKGVFLMTPLRPASGEKVKVKSYLPASTIFLNTKVPYLRQGYPEPQSPISNHIQLSLRHYWRSAIYATMDHCWFPSTKDPPVHELKPI